MTYNNKYSCMLKHNCMFESILYDLGSKYFLIVSFNFSFQLLHKTLLFFKAITEEFKFCKQFSFCCLKGAFHLFIFLCTFLINLKKNKNIP